jgi:peptide/nickel transport system substrate-binding protein
MRRIPLAFAAVLGTAALAAAPAAGVPDQTPKRGGTVVVPGGLEFACLNPFAACNLGIRNSLLGQVLEGAFKVTPDLGYRPDLVSRADIVSRTPFTVVYRIRAEARWSDGAPITSSDFVFTHRIFRDHATSAPDDDRRPDYRRIRRVVRVDEKTARVVFRERFAEWRTLFEHVLPRHVLAGEDITAVWRTSIDDPKTGRPIGSGPFLIGTWERGRQITLVRNRRYWGGHTAYLDRLVATFSSPAVSGPVEALESGYRDVVALVGTDPSNVAGLHDLPGVTVRSAPAVVLEYLLLRVGPGGHPALGKRLVRQALVWGLNRTAIARVRSGDARLKSDSAVLATVSRFYQPTWSRYRFDPARARGLLEQAGCQRGADAIYVCDGERLSLRFVTTAGNPLRQQTLELIQAQLRASGIEARLSYAPNVISLIQNVLRSAAFDVALINFGGVTDRISGPYCGGHDENWTGYCSRLTNRDLVDADVSVDERQRARVLNRADAKLARDVPVIPLTALQYTLAYRSKIRDVIPNPVDPLWEAENWWLER